MVVEVEAIALVVGMCVVAIVDVVRGRLLVVVVTGHDLVDD